MQLRNVTVADMAAAREMRAQKQKQLLDEYDLPLVSFSLNIPGAIKTNDLYEWAFEAGVIRINATCLKNNFEIAFSCQTSAFTGSEYYALIRADALAIKKAMVQIEEADMLGRIFDIDVIAPKSESSDCHSICLLSNDSAHSDGNSMQDNSANVTDSIACNSRDSFTNFAGRKVTRAHIHMPERTCLLCSDNAYECARSRAHSVEELIAAIDTIICKCRGV